MVKKFILAFAILALVSAIAGTASTAPASFRITLLQPSVVNGTELRPGEYRLNLENNAITLVQGKVSVAAPAKIETVDSKFDSTAIRYTGNGSQQIVSEIRLGGSKTKVVLNP